MKTARTALANGVALHTAGFLATREERLRARLAEAIEALR